MADQLSAQLPYQLTTGVTATREGLVIDVRRGDIYGLIREWPFTPRVRTDPEGLLVAWPDAAERLRYLDGEPWCFLNDHGVMVCDRYWFGSNTSIALHRLAAILCDDAEGFRVLHWCVHNLGEA